MKGHYSNLKKNVKLVIYFIIAVVVVILSIIIPRYFMYAKYIGKYEIVEGTASSPLKLNLFSWSNGNKSDAKCNLWGCNGYSHGNLYYIKDGRIKFYNGKNTNIDYIEYTREGNDTYIIITVNNIEGIPSTTKWKKVK